MPPSSDDHVGLTPRMEARQLIALLARIAAIEFSVEVVIMMTFSAGT